MVLFLSVRGKALLFGLASTIAILSYAWFRADLPPWWRSFGGGIPYVLFWISTGFLLIPRRAAIPWICLVVTLGTCALEFLQLWDPAWLHHIRATRPGAALLGATFAWSDIPPYLIGGITGFGILQLLVRDGRADP